MCKRSELKTKNYILRENSIDNGVIIVVNTNESVSVTRSSHIQSLHEDTNSLQMRLSPSREATRVMASSIDFLRTMARVSRKRHVGLKRLGGGIAGMITSRTYQWK